MSQAQLGKRKKGPIKERKREKKEKSPAPRNKETK
jgi:hypothetical protein